jgi:hypothetical protein
MTTTIHRTVNLGDVVVAAFDEASHWASEPAEISRLATRTVRQILKLNRKTTGPTRQLNAPSRGTP